MQNVTIIGNVCNDLTLTKVGEESYVTRFRVACSRRVQREPNKWEDTDQLYIYVECWGELAQNAKASLIKGRPVLCHGKLVTQAWEGKDGQQTSRITLVARHIGLDLNRYVVSSKRSKDRSVEIEGLPEPVAEVEPDQDFSRISLHTESELVPNGATTAAAPF